MNACKVKKIALTCMVILLSACSSAWQPKKITDVNNLHGLRVGVNLSWESDYLLTGRTDMEIYRYDTMADMLMALNYDKIDAIAADLILCKMLETATDGVERVEPAFGETGYVLYFNPRRQDCMDEYNAFLVEYMKTDDYRDYQEREKNYDESTFDPPIIPQTGTGETLNVAVEAAGYPRAFFDTEGNILGYDTEALIKFANAYNYQLNLVSTGYENAILGLKNDLYDIAVGYISDAYRLEAEEYGILVSEPFTITPVYFLQKTKPTITFDYTWFEEEE